MTDEKPAGAANPPPPAASPAARPPRRRRWRRRLAFAAIGLVLLLVLLRFGLVLALPTILAKVAKGYDLTCTYERLDLSALAGDVELWHLVVSPIEGGEPIADLEYCRADLSMLHLFTGKIVVRRLEIDGFDLLIERDADGKLALLKRMERARAARGPQPPPVAPPPEPESPKEPAEIDLTLPVRIDALRAQHVRTRIVDRSVTPTFDARVDCHFRISDLGSMERAARLEADVSSPTLIDHLAVEGRAASAGKRLEAYLDLAGRGFHPPSLAAVLAPFGIRPADAEVAFGFRAHVRADPSAVAPHALTLQATIESATTTAAGEEAAALDKLHLAAEAVGPGVLHVGSLALDGARLHARRLRDGAVRFAGFDFLPASQAPAKPDAAAPPPPAPAAPPAPPPAAVAAAAPARDPGAPPPPPPPAPLIIRELAFRGGRLSFTDEGVKPRADLVVEVPEVLVKDIVNDPSRPPVAAKVEGKITAPNLIAAITLHGEALPFAPRKTASFQCDAAGIRPDALRPYLDAAGLDSRLENGNAAFRLEGALEVRDGGRLGLEAALHDLRYRDDEDLFTLAKAAAAGIEIDPREKTIRAAEIAIAGARTGARRDAEGGIEALGFRRRGPGDGARPRQPAGPPASPGPTPADGAAVAAPQLAANHNGGQPTVAVATVEAKTPPAAGSPPPPAPGAAAAPPAGGARSGYRIEIGRFAIEEVAARFADEAVAPPASIVLANAGVELRDVRVDLDPGAPLPEAAALRAWLAAPGLAEDVSAQGRFRLQPAAPLLDAEVVARRVSVSALAPYLKAARLEPAIADGTIRLRVETEAAAEGDVKRATMAVTGVAFTDGAEELAGVDAFRIREARLGKDGLTVAAIEIEKPRARGRRDAAGEVKLGGFRVLPAPAAAADAPADPSAVGEATAAKPAPPATATAPAAAQPGSTPAAGKSEAPPSTIEIQKLLVTGGTLLWDDAAVSPAVASSAITDLEITGLVTGKDAEPARLRAALRVPETLEALEVNGTFSLAPAAQGLTLDSSAHGLRAGPLAAYFPEGKGLSLADGRLRARLEAGAGPAAEGGRQASFSLSGVEYRDGASGPLLFGLDSLRFIASRLDPAGGLIKIDEVSLAGLEANAERREDGSIQVLGFLSRPAANQAAAAPSEAPPEVAAAPPAAPPPAAEPPPAKPPAKPEATPTPPAAAEAIPPAPRPNPPVLAIGKVDLEIKRLAFTDRSRPGSAPVEFADVRLRNPQPIELLGEDHESRPPVQFDLTGKLTPLMQSFGAKASIEPFAPEPSLKVEIAADGVRGEGLTEVLPDLREKLDGKSLSDGKLRAQAALTLRSRRRHALDFDLAKGFGFEFEVKQAAFRNADGPVLLGLDELLVDVAKVDPATGGVHVRTIEFTNPQGLVTRKEEGVEVLGLLVKMPPRQPPADGQPAEAAGKAASPAAPPTAAPEPPAPAAEGAGPGAAGPATPPPSPGPEVKVDSFVVSGIDFTYEDTSVDPPMKVPLRTLDVGISRITNRALVEQRPVRFSVVLGSGKVTLPRRLGVGLFSSVAGGVADAATVAGGGEVADLGKTEERLFFEEVLLNGNVALYPAPTGWMKVGVSGLELANLKGLASKTAVTLEGGIFDLTSDLRMRDGTVLKKTRVAFDSLVVSEQPDGPILRYLHLPTPVQGVVFVLRDEEDTIHIPLRVRAEKGVLNTASLTGAILESLATVIARAIAASPLRLATALVPGGSEDKQPGDEPIPLEFEAGGIDVSRAALAGLAPLIERLIADDEVAVTLRHELGAGDFERMRVRANPPREEAIQIAEGLRAKRADLLRVRSEAVERARATFAAGLIEEERLARTAVRDLDAELGNTERALDKLGDLLRRGAENREPRRTRAACIELGRERLAAVHEALIKALAEQIPGIEERLRIERAKAGEPVVEAGGRVLAIAGRKKL